MSNLATLIRRNVAGKNGGPVFYPGEPDPMAAAFGEAARTVFGQGADDALVKAESVLMLDFLELYRRSGHSPARLLGIDGSVLKEVLGIFDANRSIASPLFLATRYLIRKTYAGVELREPVLELGMGAGDTAKAILGERKIAVGTTPIIDEVLSAKSNYRNHRLYLAAEAGAVPFADETFNTVVMNYTFYHLEDPAAACREILRVLAPGGRFHFNLALREAVDSTRVLPRMIEALGLRDFSDMAGGYVFTDYGGRGNDASTESTVGLLEETGFTGVQAVGHLSAPLSRLIWFTRDLQILFLHDLQRALGVPRIEAAYREFVSRQIAALLTCDEELCAREGATYAFITAVKPGSRPAEFPDADLVRRLRCPLGREPLEPRKDHLRSRHPGTAYPVYRDIPLLIPVYSQLWREQNPGVEDPDARRTFSY